MMKLGQIIISNAIISLPRSPSPYPFKNDSLKYSNTHINVRRGITNQTNLQIHKSPSTTSLVDCTVASAKLVHGFTVATRLIMIGKTRVALKTETN